uniref:Uncharacterized protein n=1 Tax=Rhizophora mucronata TaxID=61149 RepID=A0A2P2NWN4_RHIMU
MLKQKTRTKIFITFNLYYIINFQ